MRYLYPTPALALGYKYHQAVKKRISFWCNEQLLRRRGRTRKFTKQIYGSGYSLNLGIRKILTAFTNWLCFKDWYTLRTRPTSDPWKKHLLQKRPLRSDRRATTYGLFFYCRQIRAKRCCTLTQWVRNITRVVHVRPLSIIFSGMILYSLEEASFTKAS